MKTDFVVIGSGLAGLNFALRACEHGRVLVVTKKSAIESNTNYAQGGVAAVLDPMDTFESHYEDTLRVGYHHNNKRAVRLMVRKGPALVRELLQRGVGFQTKGGAMALTLEGGHSRPRVAFVGDATGHAIEESLIERVRRRPGITIWENSMAAELIVRDGRCHGALVLRGGRFVPVFARATILATGGLGRLYRYTTNPPIATGDGVAMAWRAGCRLQDLEFIQFHPTALNLPGKPAFLLSEALRGEGALLRNATGERFMEGAHSLKELAPRDVVARAVFEEMKRGPVHLDFRHETVEFLARRFPTIYAKLKGYDLDLARDLVPISPASHYSCGGVKVDLQGETSAERLFAFGEVACTGVHGANRLASNSLLETLVFSNQILKVLESLRHPVREVKVSLPRLTRARTSAKRRVQALMWEHVGLVRTREGLTEAIARLSAMEERLPAGASRQLIEVRNMIQCGRLVAEAALKRKKSLGCHLRADGPA